MARKLMGCHGKDWKRKQRNSQQINALIFSLEKNSSFVSCKPQHDFEEDTERHAAYPWSCQSTRPEMAKTPLGTSGDPQPGSINSINSVYIPTFFAG